MLFSLACSIESSQEPEWDRQPTGKSYDSVRLCDTKCLQSQWMAHQYQAFVNLRPEWLVLPGRKEREVRSRNPQTGLWTIMKLAKSVQLLLKSLNDGARIIGSFGQWQTYLHWGDLLTGKVCVFSVSIIPVVGRFPLWICEICCRADSLGLKPREPGQYEIFTHLLAATLVKYFFLHGTGSTSNPDFNSELANRTKPKC